MSDTVVYDAEYHDPETGNPRCKCGLTWASVNQLIVLNDCGGVLYCPHDNREEWTKCMEDHHAMFNWEEEQEVEMFEIVHKDRKTGWSYIFRGHTECAKCKKEIVDMDRQVELFEDKGNSKGLHHENCAKETIMNLRGRS